RPRSQEPGHDLGLGDGGRRPVEDQGRRRPREPRQGPPDQDQGLRRPQQSGCRDQPPAGAAVAGGVLVAAAGLMRAPEALILFGVALSSFAGAATALIFNLSPSPIAQAEVMAWLLGSVQNRSWVDVAWVAPALAIAAVFAALSARGLRMLTLGDETAATSGLSMGRLRGFALIAAALATGAAVAVAGVIGFVGLAAPHLVRAAVRGDAGRILAPSALAGGLILVVADLAARLTPTDQELKLGVFTALIGAPLFALIAWRAAREWRL
ncbi:FecCD family ABC transporter permease, partial [Brevundimonas aurantiaca]|uniref:FecCD family ABC transporter permease n=1 Tax=Brevundimonas aurantiaca TaxID=74316 RepID=UPI00174E37B9